MTQQVMHKIACDRDRAYTTVPDVDNICFALQHVQTQDDSTTAKAHEAVAKPGRLCQNVCLVAEQRHSAFMDNDARGNGQQAKWTYRGSLLK